MDSPQTLHDFVLNLLSDPDARMAFQLDPEGALHDAGLADVNAQDVQEAIPLVVDYAPAASVAGLESGLSDLAGDALRADPAGAAQQLQQLTGQLPVAGLGPIDQLANDFNLAASGSLVGGVDGVSGYASLSGVGSLGGYASLSGVGVGLTGPVDVSASVDHPLGADPAGTLSDLTSTATGLTGATGVLGDPGSLLADPGSLLSDPGSLLSDPGSLLSDPGSALNGTLGNATGLLGGQDATGTVGGLTHTVTGSVNQVLDGHALDGTGLDTSAVTGTVDGVTGDLGSLSGSGLDLSGVTSGLTGGLDAGASGGGSLTGSLLGSTTDTGGHLSTTSHSAQTSLHTSSTLQPGSAGDLVGQVTQATSATDPDAGHLLGLPLF